MTNTKERVTINIEKSLMDKVRKQAREENRSYSNLICTAIAEYIKPRK